MLDTFKNFTNLHLILITEVDTVTFILKMMVLRHREIK